jgi:arsenate reductase (thioredoxin)
MNQALANYIKKFEGEQINIAAERKQLLERMATYISDKKKAHQVVSLVFICTHNSRRSHLSQIWASTLAHHFGIDGIVTYSGGTEVTAFNIRAVNALHKAGFGVISPGGSNPKYEVSFSPEAIPLVCYSKTYDCEENPKRDFAAVMTCTGADDACPIVSGADARFSLYYNDPKEADDTPWEAERYEERLLQIGSEIYLLMKEVSKRA